MNILNNKKILLGITGSIAAYKSAVLCRLLKKDGAQIKIVMTEAAKEFITPLTMETISENHVYCDMFCKDRLNIAHIDLVRWADLILVAPATADIISRVSAGRACDLLSSTILAKGDIPLFIAPAMNTFMWNNPITQMNITKLKEVINAKIIDPSSGDLACRENGEGRMEEPEKIVSFLKNNLISSKDLTGLNVLITAGGTQEDIDPVRYITNRSSGKMGYCLAIEAANRGANVTLISAPTNLAKPNVLHLYNVRTASQMYEKLIELWKQQDIIIMAAAVADFSPEKQKEKIKRGNIDELVIKFNKNPDILATIGKLKGVEIKPKLIGFALESNKLKEEAIKKLKNKNCDVIIGNLADSSLELDTNKVTLYFKEGNEKELPEMDKQKLANLIWSELKNSDII